MGSPRYRVDERLKEWATPRQCEIIDEVNKARSFSGAARALGIRMSAVQSSVSAVEKKAAIFGYSPRHDLSKPVAPGQILRGASTLYRRGEPEPVLQWVKSKADDEAREAIVREAISALSAEMPKLPAPPGPENPQTDIIPWIQIGDAHIGLLCHASEVGESFDLAIAERELCAAVFKLIDEAPFSERIVVNDLGDGTHYANFAAVSNNSGHAFDYDSRFPKMIRVYSRVLRAVVDRALTKANHVDVIINQGNHSRENDVWIAELLRVAYADTGRVHILNNDSVFIAYRMGKTLVMVHHSDKCKPKDLIGVMTTDFRKDFGETEYHLIDVGHVHHHFVSKEHPSIVIESWNHLAATDRWAHDLGYRSRKSITMVYRSKTYGDVGRRHLPIEEVRDILERSGTGKTARAKSAFTV